MTTSNSLERLSEIYYDPQKSAELLNLEYVTNEVDGIKRNTQGKHFVYKVQENKPLADESHINFIDSLKIPPAWQNVWIASKRNFHIQATGIDSKGRRQYIYHPKWREFREILKYYKLIIVGEALPKIREIVEHNLQLPGYSREKVLSAIIKIIDNTYIRIGN